MTQASVAMSESAGPSPSNMGPGGTLPVGIRLKHARNKDNIPRGINRICKSDYVWLPMPDNRASEVANDRLIKRDLSEPGIHSDGLRVSDLVNLPPRHCRKPGSVTVFDQARRKPYGPWDCVKIAGRIFKALAFGTNDDLSKPFVPPRIISRAECQHWKHGSVLRPRPDDRTRVTKAGRSHLTSFPELPGGKGASVSFPTPYTDIADAGSRRSSHPEPKPVSTDVVYPPLPEIPVFDEYINDGNIPFHQDEGAGNTPPLDGPGEEDRVPLGEIGIPHTPPTPPSDSSDSGEEGVRYRCHPCPHYPTQIHHWCHTHEQTGRCRGYNYMSETPESQNPEEIVNDFRRSHSPSPAPHEDVVDRTLLAAENERGLFGWIQGFYNHENAAESLRAHYRDERLNRIARYSTMDQNSLTTESERRDRTLRRYKNWYEWAKERYGYTQLTEGATPEIEQVIRNMERDMELGRTHLRQEYVRQFLQIQDNLEFSYETAILRYDAALTSMGNPPLEFPTFDGLDRRI